MVSTPFLKYTRALPFFLILLSSCTKVIDLNLNDAEKKYVIEGVITDQAGTSRVLISQTKDFDEDNGFVGVSGAIVTITESGGATTPLPETSTGVYEAPALRGAAGKSYTLSVTIGDQHFTGSSTIPGRVNLDTIFTTDELLFTDTRKIVNAVYKDPPGRGNNYRFIQYVNDIKEKQILIQNDEYTDSKVVNSKLFYFSDDDDDEGIQRGDEVRIEMLCIDANVYKYWFSLSRSATGGSGQATPSNPVSNLDGGALGYFSAQTYQSETMIVP